MAAQEVQCFPRRGTMRHHDHDFMMPVLFGLFRRSSESRSKRKRNSLRRVHYGSDELNKYRRTHGNNDN